MGFKGQDLSSVSSGFPVTGPQREPGDRILTLQESVVKAVTEMPRFQGRGHVVGEASGSCHLEVQMPFL